MARRPGATLLLAGLCACAGRGPGAISPERTAGTVVLPPGFDTGRTYPVVVFLPNAAMPAPELLHAYLRSAGLNELVRASPERQLEGLVDRLYLTGTGAGGGFVLLLADGQPVEDDYRTGEAFARTIARYESQVMGDLAALAAGGRVDTARLVLAGFSFGGDLAWAIALRNPGRIAGAIVIGSRATYRTPPVLLRALGGSGARFFHTIGGSETRTRLSGARAAARLLDSLGVAHQLREIPGLGHWIAPPEVFAEALAFVLEARRP